tara:strand:+ start:189 stop:512 length:324 start_codon:yes stop_codon:yes gene_type:complete
MTSDSEAKNIDIKGLLCKTSAKDFEALDDITPLPRNKDAAESDADVSPANRSLSKLEARLNSIKRVPKERDDSKEDSISRIQRMRSELKDAQKVKVDIKEDDPRFRR